jgi:hypothetical protein
MMRFLVKSCLSEPNDVDGLATTVTTVTTHSLASSAAQPGLDSPVRRTMALLLALLLVPLPLPLVNGDQSTAVAAMPTKPAPWAGSPCYELPKMRKPGCRPSYLIIGADKSGTSSLYYYVQAHPQVTAARQKQIQFFDHAYSRGAESYIRNSFPHSLEPKHVTGEASPGYMVYSEVPQRVKRDLPEVRILLMARDPVERAWSGYKYNYLRALQRGAKPIPFDTMIRWEIDRVLEPCMREMQATASRAGPNGPRIDMSKSCYGKVPKKVQFKEVYSGEPDFNGKTWPLSSLPKPCSYGCHQFVGRGLYINMMAWWYDAFPADQIHIVCTEELSPPAVAARTMSDVAAHIGLDSTFDFMPTVSKGRYNVEGHEGYETITSWDVQSNSKHEMHPKTREYLTSYFRQHNEKLFELMGRRCPWQ